MLYQNVDTSRNSAVFINMDGLSYEATFKSKSLSPVVGGNRVPMVKSSVTLRKPTDFTPDCADCAIEVWETAKLEYSLLAATDVTAFREELLRLVDKAVSDYHLLKGFVPPVAADFETI